MTPKYGARPIEPYLGFGDFFQVESQAELEIVSRSVHSAGYAFRDEMYVWEPERVVHAHTPGDFLFSHYLSRYSAAEIDANSALPVFRVFTLGGSLAQGSSASSKSLTWHSVLENRLNDARGAVGVQNPVHVYNCGMGGFVTTQERLALILAVCPRKPDMVIILNGVNDLILPLSHGVRPGDPYLQSTVFKYWYERPSRDHTLGDDARKMLNQRAARVLTDPRLRHNLLESIFHVYIENMDFTASLCQQLGCPAHLFFQPWRDKSRMVGNLTVPGFDFSPETRAFLADVHGAISAHMSARHSGFFHDLSHLFSRVEEISLYTDAVHVNDEGHRILADVIFSSVKDSWTPLMASVRSE